MDTRMTTLETRFDTILPSLATKEDLKILENKLTNTIHANNWKMIIWMTTVIGVAFTGVFYMARYLPA